MICHAYRQDGQWVSQHAFSINRKRSGITRDDLLALAEGVNIKRAGRVIDEVQAVVSRWPEYAESVGVRPDLMYAIGGTLVRV